MQIQVQDFPSDPHGETYNVRAELTKCLQRACTSDSGAKVLSDVIKFSIGKLKEADSIRAAAAKLAADEAAQADVPAAE